MKIKRQNGITLIALVITIIVLMILAGVAINITLGENGIFNKSQLAALKYKERAAEEKLEFMITELRIDKGGSATLSDLIDEFSKPTRTDVNIIDIKTKTESNQSITSNEEPEEVTLVVTGYEEFNFTVNEELKIIKICGVLKEEWNGTTTETPQITQEYTLAYNTNGGSEAPEGLTQESKQFTITNTVPSKIDYIFNGWNTKQDGSGTRYISGASITIEENTTLYAQWVQKEYDFDYVETNGDGYVQTFTVPATGTYRLEVWGAQGGNSPGYSNEGKGGYSVGEITLNKNTNLYIAVGGQGVEIGKGYNGGGIRTDSNWNWFGGSGGGATHIAINNNRGELVNYASNQNEVLIVAGGGRWRIISIRYKKCI